MNGRRVLLVGATGTLGHAIALSLARQRIPFRALVRPATDPGPLAQLGPEIVRGDLRDPASLAAALASIETVISTANSIARWLAGDHSLSIKEVDDDGHANLIRAADAAGVERFVYVSFLSQILASGTPFAKAKLANEERLRRSPMREVIVRPDMFQEIWLSSIVGFDWSGGKVRIFGRGQTRHRYVAVSDIAEAIVALAIAGDPPRVVEIAGPEAMSREQAVTAFERALGRPIRKTHVPRAVLRLGSVLARPFNPTIASILGQSLAADLKDTTADDRVLIDLGIAPRPVSDYIKQVVATERNTAGRIQQTS